MCVSLGPADFAYTTVVVAEAKDPAIHTLIYQNTAVNRAAGGNAMVLHFPAYPMSRGNVVDTSDFPSVAKDVVRAVAPPLNRSPASALAAGAIAPKVEVFDHGIYTVVLAANAALVPDALPRVPDRKRPALNADLFAWYGRMWPDWPLALCCFDNAEAVAADPLMWWYQPRNPRRFMAPAIDCHTGGIPDLGGQVDADHWVIFGSYRDRGHHLKPIEYTELPRIPPAVRDLLPNYALGRRYTGRTANGDFIAPGEILTPAGWDLISRGVVTD